MRVFIAWGYRDRNSWIRELVYPVVKAFGDEVLHGEDMPGQIITDGVRQRIDRSDALIGFVTLLEDPGAGPSATHRWVPDGLATAQARGKCVLEVREEGVANQGGILGDRQLIPYAEAGRAECIVEIVKALGAWHETNNVTLQLLPEECAEQITPLLGNQNLRCFYTILEGGDEGAQLPARIRRIKGGLFVEARNVPRQALIQIRVECAGRSWTSDFESTDSLGIRLRQD